MQLLKHDLTVHALSLRRRADARRTSTAPTASRNNAGEPTVSVTVWPHVALQTLVYADAANLPITYIV